MCGEIQSDEAWRKEQAREYDAIIETCPTKTRKALIAAIKEKIPYMFSLTKRDWFYTRRNDVAFNRINLAIRNAEKQAEQISLI